MKRLVASIFCVMIGIAVVLLLLTASSGGITRFSPYTLEFEVQSEITLLFGELPIYRSAQHAADNELVSFLRQQGVITVVQPEVQRWELIIHWNNSLLWRDEHYELYDVLIRKRGEVIEWSKANPELARIYWTEVFKHLRSNQEKDWEIGAHILDRCWLCENEHQLQEAITAFKRKYK